MCWGVDALHNTLDWVRGDEDRVGIVVTSDFAKYDLASTGEYTQGAGAIALLVKHHPRLLIINEVVGVATNSAHDFYKPKRTFSKLQIIDEVLELIGRNGVRAEDLLAKLPDSLEVKGLLDDNDSFIQVHKDMPVYDGPYSNLVYQKRIREAFDHFRHQAIQKKYWISTDTIFDQWSRLIFHLPYAFHGKRIFSEIFMQEQKRNGTWPQITTEIDLPEPIPTDFDNNTAYHKAYGKFLKAITKTSAYREFVGSHIEKGQRASSEVGNMYACSIFLALMSTLQADMENGAGITNHKFGFFGYGSGSKSKVFEATVQPGWVKVVEGFRLPDQLTNRKAISYQEYEQLHRGQQKHSVVTPKSTFAIHSIGEHGTQEGARYYQWVAPDESVVNSAELKLV